MSQSLPTLFRNGKVMGLKFGDELWGVRFGEGANASGHLLDAPPDLGVAVEELHVGGHVSPGRAAHHSATHAWLRGAAIGRAEQIAQSTGAGDRQADQSPGCGQDAQQCAACHVGADVRPLPSTTTTTTTTRA